MWVFNKDGFFSAVQHRSDSKKVIVRARYKEDIFKLGKVLGLHKAQHTPKADYPYRLECAKSVWAKYLLQSASDIDYPNYKSEMGLHLSHARMENLHDVWSVMAGFLSWDSLSWKDSWKDRIRSTGM